ncbi:hypothetical protein Bpro_4856 [Polaromonas sp. JS666]|nr:hypothetical protein Bpro_4856 [Polaromonas sp. JS666]
MKWSKFKKPTPPGPSCRRGRPLFIDFVESVMAKLARANLTALKKTASYYVLHVTVAALVAYAVTGNFLLALTLSLLEPTVQAFAFFFHEKAWERWGGQRNAMRAMPATPLTAGVAA